MIPIINQFDGEYNFKHLYEIYNTQIPIDNINLFHIGVVTPVIYNCWKNPIMCKVLGITTGIVHSYLLLHKKF